MSARRAAVLALAVLMPGPAGAQEWNDPAVTALVGRAVARRAHAARGDLRDYRARARGFVFFLAQFGETLTEPPRLVRSDQLAVDVFWKAPGRVKQRIVGRRDRLDAPTDIAYHLDHLGIVSNDFGARIGLGQGDEVRDVPHPLAGRGPALYDYQLADSLTVRLPGRSVRVYRVQVKPKDPAQARVVGSLYLDVAEADLVIFRFSFTRAAYRDPTVEDITVVLENGLWDERHWVPLRQEIEIRRRSAWLDLAVRGIIRGRWEIGDYRFNVGLADGVFRGPEIVHEPPEVRAAFEWEQPMAAAIRDAGGPAMTFDLEEVRRSIRRAAGDRLVSGLAPVRPAVGSLSDLAHVNRVEGLALGAGTVVRPAGGAELRVWAGWGLGDGRAKARLSARREWGRLALTLAAGRQIVDVGDEPAVAPLVNSILAQEVGKDYGDYVLRDRVGVSAEHAFGARGAISVWLGWERTASIVVAAAPVTGSFRANPALGTGSWGTARVAVERRSAELALRGGASGALVVEGGTRPGASYLRLRASARAELPAGATRVVAWGWAGWGSGLLPPHRSFLLGGRADLIAEPFRAWGGRHAGFAGVEWRLPVPVPELPVGPFGTGRELVVAPFVRVGGAGGALEGVPWQPSGGVRAVAGVALEAVHRMIRVDIGASLDGGGVGVVADLRRDLWAIL